MEKPEPRWPCWALEQYFPPFSKREAEQSRGRTFQIMSIAGAKPLRQEWPSSLTTELKHGCWAGLGINVGSLRPSLMEDALQPNRRCLGLDSQTRVPHRKSHLLRSEGWHIYHTRGMAQESRWPLRSTELLTEPLQVWTGLGCIQKQGQIRTMSSDLVR